MAQAPHVHQWHYNEAVFNLHFPNQWSVIRFCPFCCEWESLVLYPVKSPQE